MIHGLPHVRNPRMSEAPGGTVSTRPTGSEESRRSSPLCPSSYGVSVYDKPKSTKSSSEISRRRFYRGSRLTTLLFLCLSSAVGLAQSRSGNLLGVVKGSGTPLNHVHVRLSRVDAAHAVAETVTGPDGRFRMAGLTWGNYMLDLTASGWRNTRIPIRLLSDTTLHISVELSSDNRENANASKHVVDEDVWFGTQFDELALEQLPNGRNIWSVLQMQEPSTVTNRFEIAGTQAALPALFAAVGASWTENQYLFNGLDVTDPYVPGLPLINPGIDSLSEFQAVVASKPAVFAGSGENLSLASPEAGDAWHGGVWLFGSGGPLQSDNENARLRQFDFPGPERLNSLLDASAQIGGTLPFASQAVPFFASLSTQQVAQSLGGFAAPIDSGVNRVLVDFAPWSRSRQRLNLLYSGQHVFNSAQEAMPTVAPSATTRGNDNYNQFQAIWNQSLRPSTAISANFGVVNAIVSSAFQTSAAGISTIGLPLMTLTGPAPLATSGLRTRYEAQGMMQSILYGWLGSHSVSFGFDWSRSYMTNRWYAMGDAEQVLVNGMASEVIRWNTPAVATQHVQNVAEFVSDAWRPVRWLMLPISLRIDTSTGQANGASQGIRWTTLEPRLGFVVPVSDRGLVLQGSWSRYGHLLQGRYLDFGNPAALGAQVFRWQDTNADGIAQAQELGPLLRVFGGPYSAIDPHLARPFTDEISFGLQEKIDTRLTAYVRFFRRDDHRRIGLENSGVPFSDYTPVQYPDPGYDGLSGTADDQIFTLYNEKPSALGQDFLLLTNPNLRASYKGLQAFADVRWWKSLGFAGSLTTGKTRARTSPGNSPFENDTGFVGSLGVNPNTVLMSLGRTYFDRAWVSKASAYYTAPCGFYLAAIATYLDGTPFGRLLFVNGFNQGPFYVRATPTGNPGGYRTQHNASIDVRLARDFRVQRGTISAYLDVFNLLNWNSNTQEFALTGPAFPLRVPLAVEAPRTIRLGTAWRF